MTRRMLTSLFAALAMSSVALLDPARAGEPPRFVQEACPESVTGIGRPVRCGRVAVPQDRAMPGGLQIDLPVVIVKAVTPKRGAPPVIYLHGGPGGGVVAGVADMLESDVGRELVGQDQDWVFFDQRGAESSRPSLDCGDLALNDAGPSSLAVVAELQACVRRLEAQGIDFRRYTSADVVDDIRDIRTALGLPTVDLYGFSYGTRVAMSALTHDPSGIRAVVLDSPWPPEARWTDTAPVWVSREAKRLLSLCAADPACAARHGDPGDDLDRLARSMLERPVERGGRVYRPEMLALFLMDALYDPTAVRGLPASIARFTAGDLSALDLYAKGSDAGYAEALHLAVLCNEEFPFETRDAVVERARGDPVAEAVASTIVNYFEACKVFGPRNPAPIEQQPVRSRTPTLFLAAGIDAGCPAELSVEAVKGFPNGKLVVVANSTHGVSANSPCGRRLARAFFAAPDAPPDENCGDEDARGVVFN
ncbi:MAG: alpha/beta fold hydrolase [Caulobacter sp.]